MCGVWAVRCDLSLSLDQWSLVDEKEERNSNVYDALTTQAQRRDDTSLIKRGKVSGRGGER